MDTHTHGQTQNDFIICPMLYAIAMGQIIIIIIIMLQFRSFVVSVAPVMSGNMLVEVVVRFVVFTFYTGSRPLFIVNLL